MQNNQHYDLVILPPPWVPQVDQQEGKLVYFNPILNVVSEEHPAFFPIPYYTPINFTLPPWIGQSYVWIITLSKAKDLVDKRIIGKANPFAISALDLENYKTKKISNTLNPQWEENFTFQCFEVTDSVLHIEIYDYHRFAPNSFLGMTDVVLHKALSQKEVWAKLKPSPNKKSKKPISGEVLVKVELKPTEITPSFPDPSLKSEIKGILSAPIRYYHFVKNQTVESTGVFTVTTRVIAITELLKHPITHIFHLLTLFEIRLVGPGKIVFVFEKNSEKIMFKIFTQNPEEIIRAIRIAVGLCGYTQPHTYWFLLKSPPERILPLTFDEYFYEGFIQKILLWASFYKNEENLFMENELARYLAQVFDSGSLDLVDYPNIDMEFTAGLFQALKFNNYFRTLHIKIPTSNLNKIEIESILLETLKYNCTFKFLKFMHAFSHTFFAELGILFSKFPKPYYGLDFSGCNLDMKLAEGLICLNLFSLDLSNTQKPKNFLATLFSKLPRMNLQSLSLTGTNFLDLAETFSDFLETCNKLQVLNLANCSLQWKAIIPSLPPSLIDLNLSGVKYSDRSELNILTQQLAKGQIETIRLNHISLSPDDVIEFLNALQQNSNVSAINIELNYCFDKPVDILSFSNSFERINKLVSLSMEHNYLTDPNFITLVDKLSNLPIKKLNISKNVTINNQNPSLVKNCAMVFVNLLTVTQTLRYLDLSGCDHAYFGPDLISIFQPLKTNKTLTYLDVSSNHLGDNGIAALGDALKINRTLTTVRFDGNLITYDGLVTFRRCLYGNTALTDVPYPSSDMTKVLGDIAKKLAAAEKDLSDAKYEIKGVIRRHGKFSDQKQVVVEKIKDAKKRIRTLNNLKAKISKTATEINTSLIKNHSKKKRKEKQKTSQKLNALIIKKSLKISQKVNLLLPAISTIDEPCATALSNVGNQILATKDIVLIEKLVAEYIDIIDNKASDQAKKLLSKVSYKLARLNSILKNRKHSNLAQEMLIDIDAPNPKSKESRSKTVAFPYYDAAVLDKEESEEEDEGEEKKKKKKKKKRKGQQQNPHYSGTYVTMGMGMGGSLGGSLGGSPGGSPEGSPGGSLGGSQGGDDGNDVVDMYGSGGPRDLDDDYNPDPSQKFFNKKRSFQLSTSLFSDPQPPWKCEEVNQFLNKTWETLYVKSLEECFETFEIPVPKQRKARFLKSSLPRFPTDITLVTQCSLDRLAHLEKQAQNWNGILSVAILLISDETLNSSQKKLMELHKRVEALNSCRLDIAIIMENPSDLENYLYPINSLRNLALEQAATDLVFLVDIDFIPSENMHEQLTQTYAYLLSESASTVFVVPAFEMLGEKSSSFDSFQMPSSKTLVHSLYENQQIIGFHTKHFAPGHKATNFDLWFQSNFPYQVNYEEGYEPYVIAFRSLVPKYDERFRGYGMNKITHLYEINSMGFKFTVLPHVFLVTLPHSPSPSYNKTYGHERDEMRIYQLKALYNTFKKEISKKYGSNSQFEELKEVKSEEKYVQNSLSQLNSKTMIITM